ncbi:MAG: type IV pilus assembly protein PilW [Gallionellaceae bacterium]|nr:MAG: type IV pilus assembly protein PilW [Gallionellaceae bacterium]
MMDHTGRQPDRLFLRRSQTGLSLVELMISLTIGLVLLAGITTLIVQQSGARREMEKSGRQIENGRYAMEILRGDIEHAGFYGEYATPGNAIYQTPDPCETTINLQGWDPPASVVVPVPIQGVAAAEATPAGCAATIADRQPDTAMLTVRRTASATIDPADVVAASGVTYLQVSRCDADTQQTQLAQAAFTLRLKDCATPAPLRGYIVRTYYVSTGATLKMAEFANGILKTESLVDGIENMQFEYGIDTTDDGAPDSYTAAPTAAQWENVMAVRVYLLARNNETTAGYTDAKIYNLGAAASAVAPGGAFKRHVYTQVVRATNPSGRRE